MTVARLRYFAGPGAQVASPTGTSGGTLVVDFDAEGFYETTDEAEIAVLDALADAPGHPVQHADKPPKTKTKE